MLAQSTLINVNLDQAIISCIVCKRKAHLYCYSPSVK